MGRKMLGWINTILAKGNYTISAKKANRTALNNYTTEIFEKVNEFTMTSFERVEML
jgi:hypothetical protein